MNSATHIAESPAHPVDQNLKRRDFCWVHIARVTIQFLTPFHLGTGRDAEGLDAVIVRDANGLPAIPGTSIAGVLSRRLAAGVVAETIFGFQKGKDGCGSRVNVSWGCIHNQANTPVEGFGKLPADDPVLDNAKTLGMRDHVRVGHLGVVDGTGKFDNEIVSAGHRFTFEVEMLDLAKDSLEWKAVLDAIRAPGLRLGAKTRSGLGHCTIHKVVTGSFDLSTPKGFEAYCAHPVALAEQPSSLVAPTHPAPSNPPNSLFLEIDIKPRNYWMFGGGEEPEGARGEADMTPVRDARVEWDAHDHGSVRKNIPVIPGSSLKGALAHRTAFHWNLLKGNFADGKSPDDIKSLARDRNDGVLFLFGDAKGQKSGHAGRIFIDDIYLEALPPQVFANHNSIDRFSNKTREGVLFSERPFVCSPGGGWSFPLRIELDVRHSLDREHLHALKSAIEDIAESRLSLGAGSGRGLGFCEADLSWPEAWNQMTRPDSSEECSQTP